jgi:hypothetical protein
MESGATTALLTGSALSPDAEPWVAAPDAGSWVAAPDAGSWVAVHVALPLLPAVGLPLALPPEPPLSESVAYPINFNHVLSTVPTTRSFDSRP